jgi:hypothetical protein
MRGCASSNSFGVEIVAKFVVNLTRYGYDRRALRRDFGRFSDVTGLA